MDFYFTDRSFRLIEIATTTANGSYSLTNDELVQSIADGSKTFTADLPFTPNQEKRVTEMTKVGNYVLFIDSRGHHNFQTIMETKKDNSAINITCLDATVDLANETVDAYKADKAYPIAHYLELFTRDSGFEIGINEVENLSRKLEWDSSDETSKARILSVAKRFDAELDFTFEITGTRVIKCYINIRKHNGSDKDIRLTLNHEVNAISTSENIWDLATSIRPIGGTPEGQDEPISLNGYKWTDPDGRYVLRGATLLDTVANKYWTRLRTGGTSDSGAYINRVITYEAVTQARLLQSALSDLKKRASVATTYEVDIAVLPDNVEIGDTVHIVDEKQELFLSARVLEMTESYAFNTHKATLGDYLIEENEVSLSLQQLAEKMKTLANKPVYTWIAYADTADGQGISLFPDGKAYIGIAVNMVDKNADINDPSKFNWQLTKGEPGQPGKDGTDGVPGAKGADGRTSYFHTAWADSENGSIGFTTSGGDGKKYVGTYSDFTKEDSTEPSKYNWALFKGADGKDGYTPIKGSDYFDGKDGQDGKSSYLWIRYSENANGTGMTSDPTGAKYVGYATTQTATAPTLASAYKWQLVAGKDGIAGEKGTDGKTSYLHIRYSNDGGKTFTANSGETVGTHIGQYTDFIKADSNSVSDYKWALIKGEKGDTGSDGRPGKDGTGLATTTVTYQESTSGTTIPSGVWTASVPNTSKGKYLWTRTIWTYTDKTSETGYSVSYIAKDGNDGSNGIAGKDGVGIKSTTITYANSTSGTTAPTSGWTANPPVTSAGQFIWTKTVWSYTDGTNETGYSVGKIGEKGDKGDSGADGRPGKDGVGIKSTAITYALGDSGTAKPTTGWATSVPSLIKGKYLWTKTVWLYTDNTSESGYSATYIGKDGNDGSNGIAGKDGVGIKSTTITYASSTSGTTAPVANLVREDGWTALNGGTIAVTKHNFYAGAHTLYKLINNKVSEVFAIPPDLIKLSPNTTYTLKFIGFASQNVTGMDVWMLGSSSDGNASQNVLVVNNRKLSPIEAEVVTATFTTDNVTTSGHLRFDNNGSSNAPADSWLLFAEVQIVEGSTAGPYEVVSPTDSTWSYTPPAISSGQFIWTKTIWTYTDGTTEAGYSVGKIGETGRDGANGIPGKAGADGRTPYFHQAWADSQDGKTNFSKTVSLCKKYLGTYTDYVADDSADPTKYKWTELVGAIEVGGRNYFLNSDFSQDETNWSNGNNIWFMSGEKCNGQKAMTATPTVAWTGGGTNSFNQKMNNITNQQVTVSVWAKASKSGAKFHSEPNGGNGAFDTLLTNTWKRYSYVAQTNTVGTIFFMAVDVGTQYWISMPQVEIGNKVTDWSPAPEDVQAYTDQKAEEALAKAKNEINLVPKITSGTSFPSTRKNGDMHWMTNSAGVVIGYYKFNGSQWVVQKIDAQSLNVSSLSALSTNLGTVTAGTINGVTINGSKFGNTNGSFSIDQNGNIKGASITGSEINIAETDTPEKHSTGFLLSDGLLFSQDYKNAKAGTDMVRSNISIGWDGMAVTYDYKNGSHDYAAITSVLGPALYVSRFNSDGQIVYSISLEPDGILASVLDSSGKEKKSTVTPDQLIQLSKTDYLLWIGTMVMSATQTVTPSLPLDQCLHGWMLLWSQASDGISIDARFIYQPILKSFVEFNSGKGLTFPIAAPVGSSNPWGNNVAKYLYVTSTTIKGYPSNNQGVSNDYILREVRAF